MALESAIVAGADHDRPAVGAWSWDDVILPDETRRELQELQRLIEDPDRARACGIEPPRGALLYGPPGTGKTLIARILASQAGASFYPVKGSDIVSKWLGESEQNVAALFERARDHRPAIVFLDELDAIAPARNRGPDGNQAIDRIINQLLREIDGLERHPGVFVLGATNRRDILDEAMLRGGRLGRHIEIGLPTVVSRLALLKLHSRRMPLDPDVDLDDLVARTGGFSGADLVGLCQEAAIQALMRSADHEEPTISPDDVLAALAANETRR